MTYLMGLLWGFDAMLLGQHLAQRTWPVNVSIGHLGELGPGCRARGPGGRQPRRDWNKVGPRNPMR